MGVVDEEKMKEMAAKMGLTPGVAVDLPELSSIILRPAKGNISPSPQKLTESGKTGGGATPKKINHTLTFRKSLIFFDFF